MARQIPMNPDIGSEHELLIYRTLNSMIDSLLAMDDTPADVATAVANLKAAVLPYKYTLDKVKPRIRNRGNSK